MIIKYAYMAKDLGSFIQYSIVERLKDDGKLVPQITSVADGIISIYKPKKDLNGVMEPASINFSALGSVEPELAEIFAKAILNAVERANEMNWALNEEKK